MTPYKTTRLLELVHRAQRMNAPIDSVNCVLSLIAHNLRNEQVLVPEKAMGHLQVLKDVTGSLL